jgi:hypothetical protein
LLLAPSTGCE